jgi:PAS domain S-box-containing protein
VTPDAARRAAWERDPRFQQLVELAPDGILIHDGESVVLANAAALRLAGATKRAQLVGKPIDRFLNPPYLKSVEAELTDSMMQAELAPPVRDQFRRVDGSTVEVEIRAVGFMDNDRPSAHLIIRDITERLAAEQTARQVEERLQQAQRMESVGALAGGVAHEFNNMMQVVLGFSDFLVRDQRLPADCVADVREIIRAADRASVVTRQLLAFSHRAVHRPQVVDVGAAAREIEPVVRRLVGEGRELVVVADAAPHVWVDPGQLQQVVINIVLNARDAMPAGGVLTITTAETDLPAGTVAADGVAIPAGRYAALILQDTGSGMDAAVQAHIFEPFFTTRPIGQGTGLGLPAAHGIVTQNDGYITVESAPGKGATFTVFLPVIAAADRVERRAEPRVDPGTAMPAGATVLVVDDQLAIREIVARILGRLGLRVLQAADGAAALDMVEKNGPPQLVVTDLTMPGVSGSELARRVRQRWPGVPILFMSGSSAEELQRHGALDSPGELLLKPFKAGALVESVAAALSRVPAIE